MSDVLRTSDVYRVAALICPDYDPANDGLVSLPGTRKDLANGRRALRLGGFRCYELHGKQGYADMEVFILHFVERVREAVEKDTNRKVIVYLHFCGHGRLRPGSQWPSLLSSTCKSGDTGLQEVHSKTVFDMLNSITKSEEGLQIVFCLDCCRDGADIHKRQDTLWYCPNGEDLDPVEAHSGERGRAFLPHRRNNVLVLFSCAQGKTSREDHNGGHLSQVVFKPEYFCQQVDVLFWGDAIAREVQRQRGYFGAQSPEIFVRSGVPRVILAAPAPPQPPGLWPSIANPSQDHTELPRGTRSLPESTDDWWSAWVLPQLQKLVKVIQCSPEKPMDDDEFGTRTETIFAPEMDTVGPHALPAKLFPVGKAPQEARQGTTKDTASTTASDPVQVWGGEVESVSGYFLPLNGLTAVRFSDKDHMDEVLKRNSGQKVKKVSIVCQGPTKPIVQLPPDILPLHAEEFIFESRGQATGVSNFLRTTPSWCRFSRRVRYKCNIFEKGNSQALARELHKYELLEELDISSDPFSEEGAKVLRDAYESLNRTPKPTFYLPRDIDVAKLNWQFPANWRL